MVVFLWSHMLRRFLSPRTCRPIVRRTPATRLSIERLEDRVTPTWIPIGPSPIQTTTEAARGNPAVSGLAEGIAVDPTDANIVYESTLGGGVWKSTNALATNTA